MEAGKHTLTGHKPILQGLHICGDYTFTGIGVTSTASFRDIAANNIISVLDQWNILDKITPPPPEGRKGIRETDKVFRRDNTRHKNKLISVTQY